jgi:hypothetical protein
MKKEQLAKEDKGQGISARTLSKKHHQGNSVNHDFEKMMMFLVIIIAVSYGILFVGNNLSSSKITGDALDSQENQMTAMAIGGMEGITGKDTAVPVPPASVSAQKTYYTKTSETKDLSGGTAKTPTKSAATETPPKSSPSGSSKIVPTPKVPPVVKEPVTVSSVTPIIIPFPSKMTDADKDKYDPRVTYTTTTDAGSGISLVKIQQTGGKEMYVQVQSGLWDNAYLANSDGTLQKSNNEPIPFNNQQITKALGVDSSQASIISGKGFKQSEVDLKEAVAEARKKWDEDPETKGKRFPAEQARVEADWNNLVSNSRGKINTILNSYYDEWLGPLSQGIPASMCGDSLYKKESESSSGQKVFGMSLPKSSYESEQKKNILDNIKTVIVEGEKTQVSDTIYRYAVTWKLIGDKSEEWKIWLYNSCTKESSYELSRTTDGAEGWYDDGTLSNLQFTGLHMAFQLECDKDAKGCRYNQACITFLSSGTTAAGEGDGTALTLDPKDSYCVNLIYGQGFDSSEKC